MFTGGQVSVITIDEETSRARGSRYDRVLRIGYEQIEPEDLELLGGLLGLNEVQVGALYMFHRRLGAGWIERVLADEPDPQVQDLIDHGQVQDVTFDAVRRRLQRLGRMDFLVSGKGDDCVEDLFHRLNKPSSVVLEFGKHGTNLAAYLLVANFITRRLHQRYVRQMDLAAGKRGDEPKPLVIVIEEAHKFLDPKVSSDTIFGTIAREMRKYRVTLLIVDQRPSGIDDEVMSQIGTRVTCLLDNEADIKAVFSGVSGAGALREVLARLDTQQQALILGHAVPMPVVVRTRDYDENFYRWLGASDDDGERKQRAKKGSQALFGE